MRKINELARNDATDFIDRGRASDKRSPIGMSTPRQTTSTPDDASHATRSHSNRREIQKPVAARTDRSISPIRIVVKPNEDSSSLDDSQSSDIPSEVDKSDMTDEVQYHSCFGKSEPPSTHKQPTIIHP